MGYLKEGLFRKKTGASCEAPGKSGGRPKGDRAVVLPPRLAGSTDGRESRYTQIVRPPSMGSSTPVMNSASSEAR